MGIKIRRLKTEHEESVPQYTTMLAALVYKPNIYKMIENFIEIPNYLKRVREINKNWAYVLVDNTYQPACDLVKVKVPNERAYSIEHYNEYKKVWPFIYHNIEEEKIDKSYVEKWSNYVYNQNKKVKTQYCAGTCAIIKEDTLLTTQYDNDNIFGHSVFKSVDIASKSQVGYLCTGFDAFVYKEPCISCAMVFVHGRIRRVFCINNLEQGAYTKYKFCYNPHINHRYKVYFVDL